MFRFSAIWRLSFADAMLDDGASCWSLASGWIPPKSTGEGPVSRSPQRTTWQPSISLLLSLLILCLLLISLSHSLSCISP